MVAAKITTLAVLALAAADAAVSTIVITKPVASTSAHGGKKLQVEWQDDGKAPDHRAWGRVNIYLATGSKDVQYKLQTLDTNVSYTQDSGSYTIDANAGPNGGYYFLRFEGTNTSAAGGIPAMAFSARFNLDQMSGTFNSTVQQTNSGAGTGQLSAAAAAAAPSTSAPTFFSFTQTMSSALSTSTPASMPSSAASSQTTNIKSTSAANSNNKLAGFASGLVGLAAVAAALL